MKVNLNVDQKSEESAEPISGQDSLAINLNEGKSKPTIVTQQKSVQMQIGSSNNIDVNFGNSNKVTPQSKDDQ